MKAPVSEFLFSQNNCVDCSCTFLNKHMEMLNKLVHALWLFEDFGSSYAHCYDIVTQYN